ncbi:uncharacterized protein BX664DRAFT_325487 [Halteromyces radiatus]|uniref:uncharacterized protein n=1 Tax=Halteromyces radiatus TaxID=101107 RepID=UPI002220330E|nr:uncharacterized protein BX664DRAFT_325487 [Halteromyces radiatus]KAI8097058.1 hypothetical protein BX664DRAFT_325487 [Halteromyces radiatus]
MALKYGYEMESSTGTVGHLVAPPLLSKKITLATGNNTNKWLFYGTRQQILDWMRDHKDLELENGLFSTLGANKKPSTFHTHTELVIDLQYYPDAEQSYYNYCKSFFVSDYNVERVRVEIRPRIESKDKMIESLCRTIVASGSRLGDIVDDLETEWNSPAKSYYQQTVDVFTDAPPPTHVLSADPPSSIRVNTNDSNIVTQ